VHKILTSCLDGRLGQLLQARLLGRRSEHGHIVVRLVVLVIKLIVHLVQTSSPLSIGQLLLIERIILLVAERPCPGLAHIDSRLGHHGGQLEPLLIYNSVGRLLLNFLLALILSLLQTLLQGLLLEDPVVHEVEIEAFSHEGLPKHRDYLLVVGPFFEFQLSRVIEEVTEFARVPMR